MYFHCKKLHPNAVLPVRATGWSVGFDLFAPCAGSIDPLSYRKVGLGISCSFSPGYVGLLLDKSSIAAAGVTRLAGVIDPDYRQEWACLLYNTNGKSYSWTGGQKIIQVVFLPIGLPIVDGWVDSLEQLETVPGLADRIGGFGSTGES